MFRMFGYDSNAPLPVLAPIGFDDDNDDSSKGTSLPASLHLLPYDPLAMNTMNHQNHIRIGSLTKNQKGKSVEGHGG
jgi:hypothetical protein